MIHDNMNISHLIVPAQQYEEIRLNKNNRDAKRAMSFESGSLKGR